MPYFLQSNFMWYSKPICLTLPESLCVYKNWKIHIEKAEVIQNVNIVHKNKNYMEWSLLNCVNPNEYELAPEDFIKKCSLA